MHVKALESVLKILNSKNIIFNFHRVANDRMKKRKNATHIRNKINILTSLIK